MKNYDSKEIFLDQPAPIRDSYWVIVIEKGMEMKSEWAGRQADRQGGTQTGMRVSSQASCPFSIQPP